MRRRHFRKYGPADKVAAGRSIRLWELSMDLGRLPTRDEMCEALDVSPQRLRYVLLGLYRAGNIRVDAERDRIVLNLPSIRPATKEDDERDRWYEREAEIEAEVAKIDAQIERLRTKRRKLTEARQPSAPFIRLPEPPMLDPPELEDIEVDQLVRQPPPRP